MRLESYFKMRFGASARMDFNFFRSWVIGITKPWSNWRRILVWLKRLRQNGFSGDFQASESDGTEPVWSHFLHAFRAGGRDTNPHANNITDIYHLQPVTEVAWLHGLDLQDGVPLRLECLQKDLAEIRRQLCLRFGSCESLPSFPWSNKGRSKVGEGWTNDMQTAVRDRYALDFAFFGHSSVLSEADRAACSMAKEVARFVDIMDERVEDLL